MKEDKFTFNLQAFAEGEAESVELEQPTADSDTIDTPDFGIDEDGNAVFFNDGHFGDDDEVEEEEDPEVTAEPDGQPQEPETYVVKVNGQEQEVTLDELLNGYMRNQDYTRKTQALAEERRNLQYVQQPQVQPYNANPQAQPQVQQQPQQPQITQRDYYTQLDAFAKKEVENALGEKFDDYNSLHQAAYADAIANVKAEIYAARQQEAEHQRVVDNFNHTMSKYYQDPNFQGINQLALEKLNSLPYAQAVQIKQAMDNYDVNTIDAYMTAVRNEYYGANNVPTIQKKQQPKPAIKPPYVESAGAATVPPGNPTTEIDYSKLRGLSVDQQANILSQLNYFSK